MNRWFERGDFMKKDSDCRQNYLICPKCRLTCPPGTTHCDCGHDFTSGHSLTETERKKAIHFEGIAAAIGVPLLLIFAAFVKANFLFFLPVYIAIVIALSVRNRKKKKQK